MKRLISMMLAVCLLAAAFSALAEASVSLDSIMQEIDKTSASLTVAPVSFRISADRQSIYLDRPAVTGSGRYLISYNIYDSDSNPVNYFYSNEEHVAATPGYGGLFNVFVVVTDESTGETNVQDIGWQGLSWPRADRLTVGKASFVISPDRKSVFVNRPEIRCRSGSVTIAYNIYDSASRPVNYFYSTQKRVAATPGYDGKFNVFIVVTDTETGEQNVQDIGWIILGREQPTAEPTAVIPVTPTPAPTPTPTPENTDFTTRVSDGKVTITKYLGSDENVTVPETIGALPVTAIGSGAFANCKTVKTVLLPGGLTAIDQGAFRNCTALERITVPEKVVRLGSEAFSGCTALTEVIVKGAVKTLQTDTFFNCSSLESLTLSEGLETVEYHAFRWCRKLERLDLPDSLLEIKDSAFADCGLTTLVIPDSVTEVGNYAFSGCEALEYITLPRNLDMVKSQCFSACHSLKEITIPAGCRLIGSYAFQHCWELRTVTVLNPSLQYGKSCFFDCCELSCFVGYPGSTTEVLARDNGIRFVALE